MLGASGKILTAFCSRRNHVVMPIKLGRNDYCDYKFDIINHDLNYLEAQLGRSLGTEDKFFVFAGVSNPDLCASNFSHSHLVNVINTRQLIRQLLERGVSVVYSSSDAVFEGNPSVSVECSQLSPIHVYGTQKASIEVEFTGNPLFRVIRFSYVIFEHDFLIKSARSGKALNAYTNFRRNVITEFDVCDVLSAYSVNQKLPAILNCVGSELLSKYDIAVKLDRYLNFAGIHPVAADKEFFRNRVATIETSSIELASILGRQPLKISDWLENYLGQT
jgi:dTDP-4-dehydrorhamnose reductase